MGGESGMCWGVCVGLWVVICGCKGCGCVCGVCGVCVSLWLMYLL